MTPERNQPSPDCLTLADRAALLRRSALQTRLRLREQSRELERLAGRLGVARAAADAPVRKPLPVRNPLSVPVSAPVPVSVPKEAVAASAPVPASLRAETRRHAPSVAYAVLPFLAIGAAAYAAHVKISPHVRVIEPPAAAPTFTARRDSLAAVEPPAPSVDAEEGAEALLLVHDWRPAGEGRTVLELLGGEVDRPGRPPVWSVERVGTRQYLVRFRDGASEHAFEADLEARSVRPAADADALLAHR
jgi:hypothetical protein